MKGINCYLLSVVIAVTGSLVLNKSSLESKLVGGEDITTKGFRFVVSLRINESHICGGALISEYHVLTAGHCIYNIRIYGGSAFILASVLMATNNLLQGGSSYGIKDVYHHPKYDGEKPMETANYDIGVVLVDILHFDLNADWANYSDKRLLAKKEADIVGWTFCQISHGSASSSQTWMPPTLSKMTLYHPGPKACQKNPYFIKYTHLDFNNHILCASRDKSFQKFTQEDAGNPLIYGGTIVGVTSGMTGVMEFNPIRFTRTSYYKHFLKNVTTQYLPPPDDSTKKRRI